MEGNVGVTPGGRASARVGVTFGRKVGITLGIRVGILVVINVQVTLCRLRSDYLPSSRT